MAIRIGFGDRAINFVFGARDEVTPALKNVKHASEEMVRGLERSSQRIESTLDNLMRFVETTSQRVASDDKWFLSPENLKGVRSAVEDLKKAFEDLGTTQRQTQSDFANELEMVGSKMRRVRGETSEFQDQLRELSKFKLQLQDAAAAVGVGFGVGKVISDTQRVSETIDTMAIRMKNLGVTGDDLRKTLGDSMAEAKGTIGETLTMMDEAQKAGINNLDVMQKLIVDVERLSQFGGTERTPLIQMLAQMNTQLGLGSEQMHNLLEAANEMTKSRYGAGSLSDTLGFVGGLTPQLQQLANLRREFGTRYGLDPRNAERDMARTQAMAGGLYRSFRGIGLDTSSISSMLSLPTNESDKPAAVGTLMTMGGMSYAEYNRAVMTGDLSRVARAIEQVAMTPEPDVNRYLESGGEESMGLRDIFGPNVKEGMAAIRRRVGTAQSLSNLAAQNQSVVDRSFADPRDSILADQQEFMKSTAGQWKQFRADMEQAFLNIAKIFDVKNPPVSTIYWGLTQLAEKFKLITGAASEDPTATSAVGGLGALAVGGGAAMLGLNAARIGGRLWMKTPGLGRLTSWAVGKIRPAWGARLRGIAGLSPLAEAGPAASTAANLADEAAWLSRYGFSPEGGAAPYGMAADDVAAAGARTGARAAGSGAGAFSRFARFLGKVAPWLAGGLEAYSTYQDTKSVGKAAGAGLGSVGGSLAGAALGQALIPVPVVGALIGAIAGGWGGSALGRMGGGWLENMLTGKQEPKAGGAPEAINDVARSFAVEFVRELEANAFYAKIAAAVKGEDPSKVTSGESWLDQMVRNGMAEAPAQRSAVPTPAPSRPPMTVPEPAPSTTVKPGATPSPTPAPTPAPPGFLGESLADILARKRTAELEAAAAARQAATPGVVPPTPAPMPSPTPEAAAAPTPRATPAPPAVRPSSEPALSGSEPALGTRVMPTPRIEPVPQPTPSPAAYRESKAPDVNVNQTEVVRAVNNMSEAVTRHLTQLGRSDMLRRARSPLSRAADAMDI